jgi:hypothetical protein
MSEDPERKHIVVDESLFYELRELKLENGLTWSGLLRRADYSEAEAPEEVARS